MKIAICPGSFDPVTYGHLNIIERSSVLVDKLIVAVFRNPNKHSMFTMEERLDMLRETTKHLPNVEVDAFGGLLNEYAEAKNCHLLIRGLRAFSDFEYEFQRALLLKKIDSEIETVFMMTSNEYSFLSSSGIKELANFDGNIKGLVPEYVEVKIKQRILELRNHNK